MATHPESLCCPECGYDLRGQTVERCPECGFHYDKPALRSLQADALYHCLSPRLDALPMLAAGMGLLLAWLVLRTMTHHGWFAGMILVAWLLTSFLLLVPGVACALRDWILGETVSPLISPRSFVARFPVPTGRFVPLVAIWLSIPLALFVGAFGSVVAGIVIFIGVCWTVLGEYRQREAERTNRLCGLLREESEKLRRARRVTWTLAGIDCVGWCLLTTLLG